MNKHYLVILGVMTGLLNSAAYATPGEYWEVTSKMEMPGMPFAMPATTTKVCIPKGNEKDPNRSSGSKDCQMSDVKVSGNQTSWKMRCDRNGEVMIGSGEQTTTAGGYEGKVQYEGKSHGRDRNMSMVYSGKHIGGSCDTEDAVKKIKEQACDKSRYHTTSDWINSADYILQEKSLCADQRTQLCDLVRRDTPKDPQAYSALVRHDQQMHSTISITKECNLDMTATTKSICKTFNAENYNQLSASCPAEAKVYRETQRRRECEGRSYTAETRAADIRKCLSGASDASDDNSSNDSTAPKSSKPSSSNPANDVLEQAKKLRGKFGF